MWTLLPRWLYAVSSWRMTCIGIVYMVTDTENVKGSNKYSHILNQVCNSSPCCYWCWCFCWT